jgi:CTP synthase
MTKVFFVTGGVVSGIGKGITTASIALIFKQMGYSVMIKKLDPYLNVDPGTISPSQHGEVFVTDDGVECDMDLGHYERFTGIISTKDSNITSGKIYQTLLENERKGKYLGATVQTIPHVTNLIKDFILKKKENYDIILCEIGGTVGDIEALPFFEAARQIKQKMKGDVAFIHLTYIPYLESAREIKTKPTQHSVKELMSIGIVPDALICRSSIKIGKENKKKISAFCNVEEEAVIEALDVPNIYNIPILYSQQGLHLELLKAVNLPMQNPDLTLFEDVICKANAAKKHIKILIAGKYSTKESYKSLYEAINHASIPNDIKVDVIWLNTKKYDEIEPASDTFEGVNAIIIPGGFGIEGVEGKMKVIKHARENNIPILGICYGMQLMCIEFARNVLGIKNASSEEFEIENAKNIVGLMTSFEKNGKLEIRSKTSDMGGTMRLGAYKAVLKEGSLAFKCYNHNTIFERHRHRYEIDIFYKNQFEENGLIFSGLSEDEKLPEICEIPKLDFFLGVQFHPELKSQILNPHPIFVGLIKNAKLLTKERR